MDRRNFLRSMLGVAAATALPSEVWPFRKIFLPPKPPIWVGIDFGYSEINAVTLAHINNRIDVLDLTYWVKWNKLAAEMLSGAYPALVGKRFVPLTKAPKDIGAAAAANALDLEMRHLNLEIEEAFR